MSIIIKKIEFITSAVNQKGYPPPGPLEIAFAGRSNVGKSSLLNTLVGRKKLARVSSRPGRTQQINFFDLNEGELGLVDLPGYGFAKVPLKVKAGWRKMVEDYLVERPTLGGVVVILDIRREPTGDDLMLLDFLASYDIPTIIAVTKADKLSGNKRRARLDKLRPVLSEYDPDFIPFSAPKRMGQEKLWDRLEKLELPELETVPVD